MEQILYAGWTPSLSSEQIAANRAKAMIEIEATRRQILEAQRIVAEQEARLQEVAEREDEWLQARYEELYEPGV